VASITLRLELPAHFLDLQGQRAGFVLLASFMVTFLFIRTSARLMRSPRVPWWPGSVTTSGGLHLHHLVWGIVLLLISGFLGFVANRSSPWTEILAGVFGVGAGLTLDEFALWVYLRDVYWAEEGRASFEAVVVATMIGGLLLLGFAPFDVPNNASSVATLVLAVTTDLLLAGLAILKGKPLLGLVGIFVPPVSLVGAVRLASPRSPWARRFYDPDGPKMARAQRRWQRSHARRRRIADAIAGAPGLPAGEPGPAPEPAGAPQPAAAAPQPADEPQSSTRASS
jgi:hypothetical protein